MKRIIIENFGPIKKIDVPLNKELNIVIGPQASGKSTLGKAIYFCRKIRDYLSDYASQIINSDENHNELYINFLKFIRQPFMGCFGTTKHMNPFLIKYYYDYKASQYVEITLDNDHYAKFAFSSDMANNIRNLIHEAVEISRNNINNNFTALYFKQISFLENFKQQTYKIFSDDEMLLYIPAGRNLLATLPDLIPTKISISSPEHFSEIDISQMDLPTQEFISYIRHMRSTFGSRLEEITQTYLKTVKGQIRNQDVELACKLIRNILRADYVCDKDGEKLFYDKSHWVKLMFASSGQQEILWALNIIFLSILKNEKTFLVFEEPESHLFPDAQESIAKLVALMINSNKSEVLITTHSPYILTAFNMLIFSGKVEKGSTTKNKVVVDKHYRLMPDSVSAYLLSASEGTLKDLISPKRGLIDALEIDKISEEINRNMNTLLKMSL